MMCVFTRIFARFDYNYAILCSIFSIIINSIITMLCRKHIYIFFSLSLSLTTFGFYIATYISRTFVARARHSMNKV